MALSDDENYEARCKDLLRKISELAGEHAIGFVFVAQMEDANGERSTVHTWRCDDLNHAIGLVERVRLRLRRDAVASDYPPNDEDDSEPEFK